MNKKVTIVLAMAATLQVSYFLYIAYFFSNNGYLPSPFIQDKSDTFMDFYNPMSWLGDAVYEKWHSVYPPLNFYFLQLFKSAMCAGVVSTTAVELRENCHASNLAILFLYIACACLSILIACYKCGIKKIDTFLILTIALLSTPYLFSLERGNLLIVCLPLLSGVLYGNKYLRIMFTGLLINLKPYFMVLSISVFARSRSKEFCSIVLVSILVLVVTAFLIRENPIPIVSNLRLFAGMLLFSRSDMLSMPSSLTSYVYVFNASQPPYPIAIEYTVKAIIYTLLLSTAMHMCFTQRDFIRNQCRNSFSYAIAMLIPPVFMWSAGGYSLLFLLPLIPFLKKSAPISFLLSISLFLPMDFVSIRHFESIERISYLSGMAVMPGWDLTLGALIRPAMLLILVNLLCYELRLNKNTVL